MYDLACKRRWSRFLDGVSNKAIIVPMDHGLTVGPLDGISHVNEVTSWLDADVVTGIVVHKGFAQRLGAIPGIGLMIQLNGALNIDESPDIKSMLTSVKAAIRLGADGVSVQANISARSARHSLKLVGKVVDNAHAFGLPVLCMVYDSYGSDTRNIAPLRHFMRATIELGVDALKIAAPDDLDIVPEILDGFSEHTPVLFAGGGVVDETRMLRLAKAIVQYDAGGICVGRNVFQCKDPRALLLSLQHVFRQGEGAFPAPHVVASERRPVIAGGEHFRWES